MFGSRLENAKYEIHFIEGHISHISYISQHISLLLMLSEKEI